MARNARSGFTLVEVVISMALLAGVVLAMAVSSTKFLTVVRTNRIRTQAIAAADARIAEIVAYQDYTTLTTRFGGSAGVEANTPLTGMTQTTTLVRSGAGTLADVTRVTVTVTGTGIEATKPIKRIATIAVP